MKTNGTEEKTTQKTPKTGLLRKLVMILAAVIVAAAAAAFLLLRNGRAASNGMVKDPATFAVKRGNLIVSVIENGDIKAINSVDIKSEVEGRTTIISIVEEGTYITAADVNTGKVLIELDSSEIKTKLNSQQISFLSSEANYAEAKESLDIQKKQNDSDIQAGEMSEVCADGF